MRLITAHKILIASATAFFLFFTAHRFLAYENGGDTGVLLTSLGGLVACVGLGFYYRRIGSS